MGILNAPPNTTNGGRVTATNTTFCSHDLSPTVLWKVISISLDHNLILIDVEGGWMHYLFIYLFISAGAIEW